MEKIIFICEKCNYFPLNFQSEKYFLNNDTYKCPFCSQVTKFNREQNHLLETQFAIQNKFYLKIPQNKENIVKIKENKIQQSQTNQKLVLIFIQESKHYLEGLYLNQINIDLRCSLNLDKEKVLKQNGHVFFTLNNQFVTKNMLNFTGKRESLKYGKRRVSKAEHLFYCLDEYIQQVAELLIFQDIRQGTQKMKQSENNEIFKDIKFVIFNVNTDEKQNQDEFLEQQKRKQNSKNLLDDKKETSHKNSKSAICDYKLTKMMEFNYLTYKQIQQLSIKQPPKEMQNNNNDEKFAEILRKQKIIKKTQKMKYFFNHFYSSQLNYSSKLNQNHQKQIDELSRFSIEDIFNEIEKNDCNLMGVFSQKINFKLISKILCQKNDQKVIKAKKMILHNFYLLKTSQESLREKIIKLQKLHSPINIYECCLFEPFCKQRINCHKLIQNSILESFNSSKKTHTNITISKQKTNNRQNYQRKLSSNGSLYKNTLNLTQSNYFQIFWTQVLTNQQPTKKSQTTNILKSLSFSNSSYPHIFQQNIHIFKNLLLQTINQTSFSSKQKSTLKNKIINILQTNSLTKSQNLRLDRLICSIGQKISFYVFDFDRLIKQNYEELDFLDQSTLPQELKNYELTYESIPLKKNNPFKKSNTKIFMERSPEKQNFVNHQQSDDSEERQSL